MTMYQPVHESTAVKQVQEWMAKFDFKSTADGLVVTPPGQFGGPFDFYVDIPERLRQWLVGLRLLRGVPLTHLVPDPALLPPESIRFFHVDPTWTDRLVDGALSIAGIGTSDLTFMAAGLTLIRSGLDHQLEQIAADQEPEVAWKAGTDAMTGMLIRSELVRRWPELVVRASLRQNQQMRSMAILRKEAISRDIMIALFAGTPSRVEVREPDVAMRFGIEPGNVVNLRGFKGEFATDSEGNPVPVKVPFSDEGRRVLNISATRQNIEGKTEWTPGKENRPAGARDVAINLEQLPYVQVFTGKDESQGSKSVSSFAVIQGMPAIQLRRGRVLSVEKVAQRAASLLQEKDED